MPARLGGFSVEPGDSAASRANRSYGSSIRLHRRPRDFFQPPGPNLGQYAKNVEPRGNRCSERGSSQDRGIDGITGLTLAARLHTNPARQRGLPKTLAGEWE